MIHRIRCDQVELGMYVCRFGGSWFEHPFWRRRLLLTTAEDVASVRGCGVPYVEIDDALGKGPRTSPPPAGHPPNRAVSAAPGPASREPEPGSGLERRNDQREADRKRAIETVDRSKRVMRDVFESARLGRAVRMRDVSNVVEDVTAAVARNAQTLIGILRLKNRDEYTYYHSVAVCTLMVHCARHLGLDEDEVRELGFAGLLHDIGKMGVPEAVLNKPGALSEDEFALVRGHPQYGHGLLVEAGGMPEAALDVCLHHHEKIDGSGYPFGLSASEISLAARLGAICDVYDALTSDRIYKPGWTPAEAIAAMWSWEGHFDPKLLFSFMQSVGVFPTGMLVRLRSNRLGIVAENQRRASRPRVIAFYDTRGNNMIAPELVTIRDDLAADQIVAPELPETWGFGEWDALRASLLKQMGIKVAA